MAVVLTSGMKLPVIKVGRMAGQFANQDQTQLKFKVVKKLLAMLVIS